MGSKLKALKKAGGGKKRELRMCQLDVETTVEHMENTVRQYGADILAGGDPFYITINGFDDDPRELSEISEAAEICQRVIESGLFGLVGDNAALSLQDTNQFIDVHICFQLAKGGLLKTDSGWSRAFMTPELAKDLSATIDAANRKVDRLLAESKVQPS